MEDGDIIFVKGDHFDRFPRDILPKLTKKFILITHNSPAGQPEKPEAIKLLDHPLLVKWFVLNPTMSHPKLIPVPLGISNQFWQSTGKFSDIEPLLR